MSWMQTAMGRTLEWFRHHQLSEGQWEGEVASWQTNFFYGMALALAGEQPESERVQQLCDFVESCVTSEGGIGQFPGEPGNPMGTYYAILFLGWARPRSEVLVRAREFHARHPHVPFHSLRACRWILEPRSRPELLADRGPPLLLRHLMLRLLPTLMYRVSSTRRYYRQPFRPPSKWLSRLTGYSVRAGFWPSLRDAEAMPRYLPTHSVLFSMMPWLALEHLAGNDDPDFLRVSEWSRRYISQGLYEDSSVLYVIFYCYYQLLAEAVGDTGLRRRLDERVREITLRKGWLQHTSACNNIFDTGLSVLALKEAGIDRADPMVQRALQFLRAAQDPGGAWSWAHSARMGNHWRPTDMDDTTLGCLGLATLGEPTDMRQVDEGVKVLLSMQSPNGMISTWGSGPCPNIPAVSITSRAIRSFMLAGMGKEDLPVRQACEWLLQQQESNGAWVDHWVSRFIYGTAHALGALVGCGHLPPEAPPIQRAVGWLLRQQNPDGGWGENYYGASAASSAEHTGAALHALCIATRGEGRPLEVIRAGARWLADHQHGDGSWDACYNTCFGDPVMGFSDAILPMVWGLMGLGASRRVLEEAGA